jgi:hypothetical protein
LGTNAINQLPLSNTQLIQSNQQSIFNNVSGLVNNTPQSPPLNTNTYIPPVNTGNTRSESQIGSVLSESAPNPITPPVNPTAEINLGQYDQSTIQTMSRVKQYSSNTANIKRLRHNTTTTDSKPSKEYINPQSNTYKG